MKQAIIVPYMVDQNEPSRPIPQIFNLPDDVVERNEILLNIFREHLLGDVESVDLEFFEDERENKYGDLEVGYHDDLFLFVTYIEEQNR